MNVAARAIGRRGALAMAIALAASPAAAEIYRCSVDGRAVYSDRPCGVSATRIEIENAAPAPPGEATDLARAAALGRLAVGMSSAQVEQSWGKPAEIASERDGKGTSERWIYRRSGETTTVHFQGGRVSKLDKLQTLVPQPEPTPVAVRAVTVSELEEQERAEKAGERRFLREGMTQAEVRGRLGPPLDRRVRAVWFGIADCWSYPPTPKDPQTRTDLCFSVEDTRLVSIDRTIQR